MHEPPLPVLASVGVGDAKRVRTSLTLEVHIVVLIGEVLGEVARCFSGDDLDLAFREWAHFGAPDVDHANGLACVDQRNAERGANAKFGVQSSGPRGIHPLRIAGLGPDSFAGR